MILSCFFLFWCAGLRLNAQDKKFSEYVSELWLSGKKQEAFHIANQRLLKNTNDLSALLVKLDYEMEFSKVDMLPKTLDQVADLAKTTSTPNFKKHQSLIESMPETIKPAIEAMKKMTPQNFLKEEVKGYITNKSLSTLTAIEALEADGLVAPISKEEMQVPDFPEEAKRVKEVNEARAQVKNKAKILETNKISSQLTNLVKSETNPANKEKVIVPEETKKNTNWLRWGLIVIGLGLVIGLLVKLLGRKKGL